MALTFLSPSGSSAMTLAVSETTHARLVSGISTWLLLQMRLELIVTMEDLLVQNAIYSLNSFGYLKKIAWLKGTNIFQKAYIFVPVHARFEYLTENEKEKLLSEHDNLLQKLKGIRCLLRDAQMQHHQKFHKVWGQLMKTGYQNSRFAHQVERFACLYCSQVTNFGLYSPNKYYRPSEDYMPREFDVLGL